MKSKVSALMDGELDQQDASGVIESLRKDDDLQQEWETYHLIGDALRQSSRLSMDLSSSVSHKLESEPTVLSPHTSKIHNQQKHKVFAFATAASVIAMVSGWFIMTNLYGPPAVNNSCRTLKAREKFNGRISYNGFISNIRAQSSPPTC